MEFDRITIEEQQLKEIFDAYNDAIFIAVSPSCNIQKKKGNYRSALIYHKYKKVYTGEIENITSANKCALYGLIETATHIKEGKDIVLLVGGSFGFKKAIKYAGVNEGLWNELFTILESIGCEKITEVLVKNGGFRLACICR